MAFLRLITFASILFIISCTEESDRPDTRAELLAGTTSSGKTWAITGIQLQRGGLIIDDCIADNIIRYFPNGRYTVSEGLELCDPNAPIAWEGTWSLLQSETQLLIALPDSSITWAIESLNSQQQVISATFKGELETYTLTSSN